MAARLRRTGIGIGTEEQPFLQWVPNPIFGALSQVSRWHDVPAERAWSRRYLRELAVLSGETPAQALLPHLIMPAHHDVRPSDVFSRRLHGTLAAAAERGPVDFPELLLTPGVGARTVRSLAMVAEVVHGAPYRFRDPARFSLAHGGKDRHPYPVPIKVYDETIRVLKSAIGHGKLGREEELAALKRLDDQARRLERVAKGPSLETFIASELAASPELDGRSVFGWERDLNPSKATGS